MMMLTATPCRSFVGLLLAITGLLLAQLPAEAADVWPSVLVGASEEDEVLDATLREKTSYDFTEAPLIDVVEYFKDRHEIEIQIDRRLVDDNGIGTDRAITRRGKDVPLAHALRRVTAYWGATYIVVDGVVMITSRASADKFFEVRVYDVALFLTSEKSAELLADALRDALRRGPRPKEPDDGRRPHIGVFRNLLIIQDSQSGQRTVGETLVTMYQIIGR